MEAEDIDNYHIRVEVGDIDALEGKPAIAVNVGEVQ